jgi:ATP-dependent RNA helicase HelY
MTAATRYLDSLPFAPDPFQKEAAAAIDDGKSLVVTAPTGAGKTVIAEAAVAHALDEGGRAFYTTPIKALSNQKYGDLRAAYTDDDVGLLTGDNSINGSAPIVVMTTEVLRNMIYAESADLDTLTVVILDEVHYLQDRARGGVWEEVIIHLPDHVQLVCLSATVANPADFTDWVASRRGPTALISETTRPVPLETWYLAADRSRPGGTLFEPMFVNGRPNGRLDKLLRQGRNRRRRFYPPRRTAVIEQLAAIDRLPAIYFVFSRRGCEAAAATVAAEMALTTADEAEEIGLVATNRTAHLSEDDLGVLGFAEFVSRLRKGIAAHHAGMVPAFKEAVEEVFQRGLVKVVFATETLALGINMPARTVVLESLSKYSGDGHELLKAGDFTQLTGRAGRRGIDTAGTAVVLHSSWVPFGRMTGIAAAGTHPLRSSFRPTYNMAVNLVAGYPKEQAELLVQASFGQFEGQRERAELEALAAALHTELAATRRRADCHLGSVTPYVDGGVAAPLSGVMRRFAQDLVPGDVVMADSERWLVLGKGTGSNPWLLLLDESAKARRTRPASLPSTAARAGNIALPEPFAPRDREYRESVAADLRAFSSTARQPALIEPADPVLSCPELDSHIEAARTVRRLERDVARIGGRLQRRRGDLVSSFHSILELLSDRGYVDGWSLTAKGHRLRFIYNELDLRITEAMGDGLFENLDFAELAAFASMFVYEPRLGDYERPIPTQQLSRRFDDLMRLDRDLARAEDASRLPDTRAPASGLAGAVFAWAHHEELDEVLATDEAAGDLVRNCRQVIDLLRQLGDAFDELRPVATKAIYALDRGVVAAGGLE